MRMHRTPLRTAVLGALILVAVSASFAQDSPFVNEKAARALRDGISGDRAFDVVRLLTPYHRIMGSQTYVEAAEMLAGLARRSGLENVRVVRQKFEGGMSWDARSAKLWLLEPEEMKLCDFEELPVSLAVFSRSAHAEAELVDIGRGASPEDFAGVDVADKIVLTTAPPALAIRTAVWERGALGVVSSASVHPEARFDTPDQIAYIKVPVITPAGKPEPWAFMISARRYGYLSDLLRRAKARKLPVRVKAEIDTEIRRPPEQAYLWAEIPGSEIHDQDIILTAHLDEESTSANDNGSGCGSLLEIGRAIRALVREGRLAPPRRDIVLWWPNEHSSEYQFLRENPEERKNWLAAINQDMVGARQSMGSRVQQIIRTPFSLPSYLSDVIESIAESVILGNTGFLSAEEAGTPQPFSKPLLSFRGSRERYDAMVIPHSGGSDQEVFCDALVRVPGVALINNPDAYIHSSDDDLQNIDATQLKRNAFVVAAAAIYLANAGDEDVPTIAGEVFSRAVKRLGADLKTAIGHVRANGGGDPGRSYAEARNLVVQAASRERQAVESVLVFAGPGSPNAAFVKARAARIAGLGAELGRELDAFALEMLKANRLPETVATAEEKEMAKRVPLNTGTLDEYFGRRGWAVDFPGLHPIMAKECYCFVDGTRSYLDIYRAVHAEALSAGEFYYGKVTPAAVRALLDAAVAKGVLKLKPADGRPGGQAQIGGFKGLPWGASKADVKKAEGEKFIDQSATPSAAGPLSMLLLNPGLDRLVYAGKASDLDCLMAFYFAGDKLVQGRCLFTVKHSDANLYIDDFQAAKAALITSYRNPEEDKMIWSEERYKGDRAKWGRAIVEGHLAYHALWRLPDTVLMHQLRGINSEPLHAIQYESTIKEHLDLVREAREKAKPKIG